MNCFSCNNSVFNTRYLFSIISQIPLGLDRNSEVRVKVHSCKNCGCEVVVDDKPENAHNLYADDSICFEASKATNETAAISYPYSSQLLPKKVLRAISQTKICDFGCGAGFTTEFLHSSGYDVIGCDIDPKAISFLKSKGINAREAGLEILNEEKFDSFICIGVLEHFENPYVFLTDMTSHVSINDVILIFPNLHSINKRAAELLRGEWDMYLEPGHHSFYSKKALCTDMQNLGFKLADYWTTSHIGRGKLPLAKSRLPEVELRVLENIKHNNFLMRIYKSSFKLLDLIKGGDIGCYWFTREK